MSVIKGFLNSKKEHTIRNFGELKALMMSGLLEIHYKCDIDHIYNKGLKPHLEVVRNAWD